MADWVCQCRWCGASVVVIGGEWRAKWRHDRPEQRCDDSPDGKHKPSAVTGGFRG